MEEYSIKKNKLIIKYLKQIKKISKLNKKKISDHGQPCFNDYAHQ